MTNLLRISTECVSPGHPDKVADVIADTILDATLEVDPNAKVACEVMVKDDVVVLGGEITSSGPKPNYQQVVDEVVAELGYNRPELKFCAGKLKLINMISEQSTEINQAVMQDGSSENLGAGDQGIMWGYATNETPTLMPLGMFLARGIMEAMDPLRWNLIFADCKTQVTLEYDAATTTPVRVSHVVVSALHDPKLSLEQVRYILRSRVDEYVANTLPDSLRYLFDPENPPEMILNHAGRWTFGGPAADTGVTGRKLVVDAYGAECPIGGGAFSGKDGSKVDRSAAYAARYVAKNIVAAGLAKRCKVQLGYVIGNKNPVSFQVDFMGTGLPGLSERDVERSVGELFPLTPSNFIKSFDLTQVSFARTAILGHFGVPGYPWEQLSLVESLRKNLGLI